MGVWRKFAATALTAAALISASGSLSAQTYPNRAVHWIVGYPAGGGSDFLARVLGNEMSKTLAQPVVIENLPGAASVLAATTVTKAPADGYTVFSGDNGSLIYNSALFATPRYSPTKDFAPIGLMARFPLILAVNAQASATSAKDLMDGLKTAPGSLNYASPGVGSPHHLAMELLLHRAGVSATHVPYRGAAPALQDVLANQLPAMVVDTAVGLTHIRSGALRPLAVFSKQRLATLPTVPTLQELGYSDIEAYAWQGLVASAATPKPILDRLTAELQKALATPDVKKRLEDFGLEPIPSDQKGLADYIDSETRYWHPIIKARSISLD